MVTHRGARALLIGASLVVVVAGLKAAASMLAPLMVAGFLAILCVPPLRKLQSYGLPDWLALVLVVAVASGVVVLISVVIGGSLRGFQSNLPLYRQRLTELTAGMTQWLEAHGMHLGSEGLAEKLDSINLMTLVSNTAAAVVSALSNVVLVILAMIFILLEVGGMSRKLRHVLGGPDADLSEFARGAQQVQRYLAAKTIVSLATGIAAGILCAAFGVDFPLLWALLAFLFDFVPNIGSIIAAVPAVLLALVQAGPGTALGVGLGYLTINMVIGNVVEPRLMGRRLGLSTLVIFLSMVFWGWVWGPVGMLLSVPLTVIVKILLEHSDDFYAVAVFLGTGSEDELATRPAPLD